MTNWQTFTIKEITSHPDSKVIDISIDGRAPFLTGHNVLHYHCFFYVPKWSPFTEWKAGDKIENWNLELRKIEILKILIFF